MILSVMRGCLCNALIWAIVTGLEKTAFLIRKKLWLNLILKKKGILPPSADADAQANPTGDSAAAIYNRVKGEKRIPLVRLSIHG